MMYKIILLTICYFTILTSAKFHRDCHSQIGTIKNVSLTDCDVYGKSYCNVIKNKNYTFDLYFTVQQRVESLNMTYYYGAANFEVERLFENPNPCNNPNSGISCPLLPGTVYHYQSIINIRYNWGTHPFFVGLRIKNEKAEDLLCIRGYAVLRKNV